MKVAVFPGSFDPITKGHLDLINRSRKIFDKVVVAVGNNMSKNYMFSQQQRIKLIQQVLNNFNYSNVKVIPDKGLTINLLEEIGSRIIIRGLRNSKDLEYERSIADINHHLDSKVETVFLLARPKYQAISSSILKETFYFGGNISPFVTQNVLNAMEHIKDRYEK